MDADLGRVLLAVGDARAMRVGRQDRAAAQNAVMACVDAIADFDIRFFSVPGVFEPFRASNAACQCKSCFQGNLRTKCGFAPQGRSLTRRLPAAEDNNLKKT